MLFAVCFNLDQSKIFCRLVMCLSKYGKAADAIMYT